ncbi:MAG: YfiR family protein [Burkholderiales bacterium]|nr:YfiR family protein [Burkholderiales bacterium]
MRGSHLPLRALAAVLVCAATSLASSGRAQPLNPVPSGDRAKALIVANFAHFARWPASAFERDSDSLRLCVVQRSRSLATAFQALDGRRVGTRTLRVVLEPAHNAAGCHLLFVHESAGPAAPAAIAATTEPTLTIGDFDGTLARGGMVELVLVNDALRFDVDLTALRERQLSLSSEVLRLARQTRP